LETFVFEDVHHYHSFQFKYSYFNWKLLFSKMFIIIIYFDSKYN
jgi:hypothetical protein